MSVITAYKCDKTGKLFEDKVKYQKHIRKIAAENRRIKKLKQQRRAEKEWWAENFWNKVQSLNQLQAAILHHRDVFAAIGVSESFSGGRTIRPTPILYFSTFSIKWTDRVPNTHSCPHDGVTNWGGLNENAPRGYPGWRGRFDYVVQSYKNQLGCYPGSSDMWKGTRIYTGTGGGGGAKDQNKTFHQSFGFGVELFESDWPAMAEAYKKVRAWAALNGKKGKLDIDAMVNEMYPATDLKFD
jgi:hypothetical protein